MEKVFVLDTSVLIHDPDAPKRFQDNEVAIPIFVIMELDLLKTNKRFEVATAARMASRFISRLMEHGNLHGPSGVQHPEHDSLFRVIANGGGQGLGALQEAESSSKMDLLIIGAALGFQKQNPDKRVVLVSKDVNMRIVANVEGLEAQDYQTDRVEWESHFPGYRTVETEASLHDAYRDGVILSATSLGITDMVENEFVIVPGTGGERGDQLFRYIGKNDELRSVPKEWKSTGVSPRGMEQRMAFDLLMDPSVQLISLVGKAGTGKTLCALAAAVAQLDKHYDRIVLSKPIVAMGKDLGYLPGDFDSKIQPWMMSFFDNLDQLIPSGEKGEGRESASRTRSWQYLLDSGQMEIQAVHSIRGRSISNSIMIIDECFPYDTPIKTEVGQRKLGAMFSQWIKGHELPRVRSFDEETKTFVWSTITNMWHRGIKPLVEVRLSNRKIKCTDNHPFLTKYGWVKAGDLKEGDMVIADRPDEIQILREINADQTQILLGSFLGDGGFDSCGMHRVRMKVTHGLKQTEYAAWKSQMFDVALNTVENIGYNPDENMVSFSTKMIGWDTGDFPCPKTHCPQHILDAMNVKALAIWFMDDGSTSKLHNWGTLHTESFDLDSQTRMIQRLADFGVEAVISYSKDRPYLRMVKSSYMKLSELISPWVHPSMKYKVHPDYHHNLGTASWDSTYPEYGYVVVKSVKPTGTEEHVFDMEVEGTHNFIVPSRSRGEKAGAGGVVVHNCQNLSPHEIKTIVTRAAEGTKVILCGDPYQIDNQFLDLHANGLVYVTDRVREEAISGTVTFTKGQRSALAEIAASLL